jgi:hypothetical protein
MEAVHASMIEKFENELRECPLDDEKKIRRDDMVAQASRTVEETKKENDVKLLNKLREVTYRRHYFLLIDHCIVIGMSLYYLWGTCAISIDGQRRNATCARRI